MSIRGSWILGASCAIVCLLAAAQTLNQSPVGILHDDAIYVILAKSLATGEGYRYLNLPGHPHATHFPPGYPALLAVLWRLAPTFPRNVLLFKAVNVLMLPLTFVLFAIYIRRQFRLPQSGAIALAFVASLGVPSLLLTGLVVSEPLFLLLCVGVLIVAEDYSVRSVRVHHLVALGLLCALATLVRSVGVALLLAAMARLLAARRRRDAVIVGVTAFIVLIPWQLWVAMHGRDVPDALQGAYGPYATWVAQAIAEDGIGVIPRTIALTSRNVLGIVLDAVCPWSSIIAKCAAGIFLVASAVLACRRAWRFVPVTLLFIAFYLFLVLIWPVPPARYVWGVWPLLLLLPGIAIAEILSWKPATILARAGRFTLLACCSIAAVGYATSTVTGYRQQQWHSLSLGAANLLRPVVRSVQSQAHDGETVSVSAEAAVYLYTGHSAVPIYSYTTAQFFRPQTIDEEAAAIKAIVAAYPVNVVIAGTTAQIAAVQSITQTAQLTFRERDSTADAVSYAVVRSGGTP